MALTPLQVSLLEDLTPPPLQRLRDRIAGAGATTAGRASRGGRGRLFGSSLMWRAAWRAAGAVGALRGVRACMQLP